MVVAWWNTMSVVHKLLKDKDENPYCIGEDFSSDEENGGESSEDEFQVLLEKERDKGDDFDQEMHMELTAALASSDSTNTDASSMNGGKSKETKTPESPSQGNSSAVAGCYSEDYFSSGSDDENQVGGVASKSQVRRKMRSDVDLFYDPDMDAEDESWVNEQRRSHRNQGKALMQDISETNASKYNQKQPGSTKKRRTPAQKAPQSDAILSCPACLTTLCIDCQRHDIYHNQYRAMFVMNCCVTRDEVLKYDEPKHRHLGNNRKKQKTGKLVPSQTLQSDVNVSLSDGPLETYYPVKCAECSTEVAVYDEDEVYHFFNVLTSHA